MELKDLGYKVFKHKSSKKKEFTNTFLGTTTKIDIEKKDFFDRLIIIRQDSNAIFLSESEVLALCEELRKED